MEDPFVTVFTSLTRDIRTDCKHSVLSDTEEDNLLVKATTDFCKMNRECMGMKLKDAEKDSIIAPAPNSELCYLCILIRQNQTLAFIRQHSVSIPNKTNLQQFSSVRDSKLKCLTVNNKTWEGFTAPVRLFDRRHYCWKNKRISFVPP